MFTPKLRKAYLDAKAEGKEFEVVFCSCDHSPADFKEYFSTMPWKAIPFEKNEIREALNAKFGVSSIPTLLLIDEATGMYNDNGRQAVMTDPKAFPWRN